jgi:hypothetical protein
VTKSAVIDLQCAYDCAIVLQTSLDLLTKAYQSIGFSIIIRKTKIIYQSALGSIEGPPDIKISGTTLEVVEYFPYLGSCLSQKSIIESYIQLQICCAAHPSGNS